MKIKLLTTLFIAFTFMSFGQSTERFPTKVPVGTIVAWAGVPALLPDNWKICDGTQVPQEKYPELCAILADNWGSIGGVNHDLFTLPNLQGVFLRGVNQGKSGPLSDPEASKRINLNGQSLTSDKSNQVGSYQLFATGKPKNEFKTTNGGNHEHTQKVRRNDNRACGAGGSMCARGADVTTESTTGGGKHSHIIDQGGDQETRPANAYVYWIIKVK